jgi:hypothetical protein
VCDDYDEEMKYLSMRSFVNFFKIRGGRSSLLVFNENLAVDLMSGISEFDIYLSLSSKLLNSLNLI